MNQASSNSSMHKSTAETLKQIQKQGLSISIVSRDNSRSSQPLESPVSKEMKPKQIVAIDKSPKLPTRSSVLTESKATLSQSRSVPISSPESRTPTGQAPNQSVFQDNKTPGTINKTLVPISSGPETRAFGSQSWSNPPPSTESKVQMGPNRAVQSVGAHSEIKNISGRLTQSQIVFSESKSQNAKGNQNVAENKSQSRISQANCHPDPKQPSSIGRNQLSFEGKVQSNQSRNPLNSPPLETKMANTSQTRQSQNFVADNKTGSVQRTIPQLLEGKTLNNQSKLVSNKVGDVKLPTQLRVHQIMKGTPAERLRPSKVVVVEQSSLPLSNMALHNPFRVASTPVDKSPVAMDEKTLIKVNRVAQSTVKNQSSIQMKNFQSTSMQSESKAVSQVIKISSGPSDSSQKTSVSFDNLSNVVSSRINAMSSTRATPKKTQAGRTAASAPAAKKKCVRRFPPNTTEKDVDLNNLDATPPKEIKMQSFTRGLTITPVNTTSTSTATSRKASESTPTNNNPTVVVCPYCKKHSFDFEQCESCKFEMPPDLQRYHLKKMRQDMPAMVVTKNVTTTSTIEKKIVYQFPDAMNQSFHFQQAVQGKVVFETSTPIGTRGGRGRPKSRRKAEPVCYTLSSDEEEPVVFNPMQGTSLHTSQMYPIESEGSKSGHSSASEILHDENQESDDPQYPGVMDINPNLDGEEEPDEEMEYDGEEMEEEEEQFSEEVCDEEEMMPEEEDEEEEEETEGQLPTDYPLKCRSIRIGSYKVHPPATSPYVAVILSLDSISFEAPMLSDSNRHVHITLGPDDIQKMYFHFGRCLPIMFVFTTPKFGELVRKALHMVSKESQYFDPTTKDDKTQKLTFLIETITDDQKHFIRTIFPGDKKVIEIDQKAANEILVRSTPNQPLQKLKNIDSSPVPNVIDNRFPQVSNQISVTKVNLPPQPVVKLLTYPAPPLTGGIAITNEDLNCLNEGEFLNDAIIDFYLKYVFYEKLSPYYQERTHIFSSFFYPRLTHRPERPRAGDDASKTMPVRRHNQVKTWTRHVDIFSKDYIIIPVNQNVHWFLAIICYPNRVPDAPNVPENKETDSVTSTDEHEHANKVTIKEICSNGEDDSPNQDDNSMHSSVNSPYEVEEPPDSDECCTETPDSSTHPDGKQRKEMPCICIFDSLSGPNRWRIAVILREYLEMEWKSKKGTKKLFDRNTMQGFIMKCPQQTNFSDCGMYLLQFVESFFENPIPFCSPMPDLTNWFTENKINKKRQQLKDLILNLQKKQEATTASRKAMNRSHSSSASMIQSDNR